MRSISFRASKLTWALVLTAVCLIGWLARATLAQHATHEPAPLPVPEATAVAVPAVQEPPLGKADPGGPSPSSDKNPPPLEATAAADSAAAEPPLGAPGLKLDAQNQAPLPDSPPPITADDPEKSALAFLEQNQKLAEAQLKNLKDEESRVRERLKKLEAGIKRWESLVSALKQSQGSVEVVIQSTPRKRKQSGPVDRDAEPRQLEPVGPGPKPPVQIK